MTADLSGGSSDFLCYSIFDLQAPGARRQHAVRTVQGSFGEDQRRLHGIYSSPADGMSVVPAEFQFASTVQHVPRHQASESQAPEPDARIRRALKPRRSDSLFD